MIPAAEWTDYPALLPELGLQRGHMLTYPKETMVAEKVHAIVKLGSINSRMKDYYDLHEMSRSLDFEAPLLQQALQATFARRGTRLPAVVPTGLTDAFARDPIKRMQWDGFLARNALTACELEETVRAIRAFVWPVLSALASGEGPPDA